MYFIRLIKHHQKNHTDYGFFACKDIGIIPKIDRWLESKN